MAHGEQLSRATCRSPLAPMICGSSRFREGSRSALGASRLAFWSRLPALLLSIGTRSW